MLRVWGLRRKRGRGLRGRQRGRGTAKVRGGRIPRLPEEVISVAWKSVSPDVRKLPDASAPAENRHSTFSSQPRHSISGWKRGLHRGRISPAGFLFFPSSRDQRSILWPVVSSARVLLLALRGSPRDFHPLWALPPLPIDDGERERAKFQPLSFRSHPPPRATPRHEGQNRRSNLLSCAFGHVPDGEGRAYSRAKCERRRGGGGVPIEWPDTKGCADFQRYIRPSCGTITDVPP